MGRHSRHPHRGLRRALVAAALSVGALAAAITTARLVAAEPPQPDTSSAPSPDASQPRLEVSAGALSVDDRTHEARFEGQVTARWGEWTLRCDTLSVTYADAERVTAITAKGAPLMLTWSGGAVEATTARLTPATDQDPSAALQSGTLWLEGGPVLRRGRSALRGERVRVDLRTRQVRVEGVSGHLSPQDL